MDKKIPVALLLAAFVAVILIIPAVFAEDEDDKDKDKDYSAGVGMAAGGGGPTVKCLGNTAWNGSDCTANCGLAVGGNGNCNDVADCFDFGDANHANMVCKNDLLPWDDNDAILGGGVQTWLTWTQGACTCENMFQWAGQQGSAPDTNVGNGMSNNGNPWDLDGAKCGNAHQCIRQQGNCWTTRFNGGPAGAKDWCSQVGMPA